MTTITYTGVLYVRRAAAETLAQLLLEHRERLGTRKGTRALAPFKQSVLILRWFLDDTRLTQLARDNHISAPTAYRYLHEGPTVLADHAPDLSTALERAASAGFTHLNSATRATSSRRPSTRTRAAASRSSNIPSTDVTAHPSVMKRTQDAACLPHPERNNA